MDLIYLVSFAFLIRVIAFWLGSKILSIKKNGLVTALVTALLVSVVDAFFSVYGLIAVPLSILCQLAVIKHMYEEKWRETVILAVVSVIIGLFLSAYLR